MIALHAIAACAALLLGATVLLLRKGTPGHRAAGRWWIATMLVVAGTSFWIREDGTFSWIHGLSVWTLVCLACGVYFVRRGNARSHKYFMVGTYLGLLAAGLGTLAPGRLVHLLLFV